jgi:NAD(P)-dependent dehydrogenase (short-subunit alcohol dehydrogenase family)
LTEQVALVTGASRGIGKACAVSLAAAGFDVVISARTVRPGEAREHSVTVRRSDTSPLPGSLEETAALVQDTGQRAIVVPMDLTDRKSVDAAMDQALDAGAINVVVHNGRYVGPGLMDGVLDTPLEAFDRFLEAHVIAQIQITRRVLPAMLEQGRGLVMTITSGAAYKEPPAGPGKGGWGLGYAIGKAASHRLAGQLRAEFGERGIRAFNIDPGYVRTERNQLTLADDGMDPNAGAPPEAIGAVVAWLVTDSEQRGVANGATIDAQPLCRELGLHAW